MIKFYAGLLMVVVVVVVVVVMVGVFSTTGAVCFMGTMTVFVAVGLGIMGYVIVEVVDPDEDDNVDGFCVVSGTLFYCGEIIIVLVYLIWPSLGGRVMSPILREIYFYFLFIVNEAEVDDPEASEIVPIYRADDPDVPELAEDEPEITNEPDPDEPEPELKDEEEDEDDPDEEEEEEEDDDSLIITVLDSLL